MSNWPVVQNGVGVGLLGVASLRATGATASSPVASPLEDRSAAPLLDRSGAQLYTRVL